MSSEHLKEVLTLYLERWGKIYPPKRMDTEAFFGDRNTVMSHIMWMCLRAQQCLGSGDLEKASRWLGFIQGVLFCVGHYSIDEIQAHVVSPSES